VETRGWALWRGVCSPMLSNAHESWFCSRANLSTQPHLVSRAVASRSTPPPCSPTCCLSPLCRHRPASLTGFDLSLGIQTSLSRRRWKQRRHHPCPPPVRRDRLAAPRPKARSRSLRGRPGSRWKLHQPLGSYQMRAYRPKTFPICRWLPDRRPDPPQRGMRSVKACAPPLLQSSGERPKQLLTRVHLAWRARGPGCAATDGYRLSVLLRLDNARPTLDNQPSDSGGQRELFARHGASPFPARTLSSPASPAVSRRTVSLYCDRARWCSSGPTRCSPSRSLDGTYPN